MPGILYFFVMILHIFSDISFLKNRDNVKNGKREANFILNRSSKIVEIHNQNFLYLGFNHAKVKGCPLAMSADIVLY